MKLPRFQFIGDFLHHDLLAVRLNAFFLAQETDQLVCEVSADEYRLLLNSSSCHVFYKVVEHSNRHALQALWIQDFHPYADKLFPLNEIELKEALDSDESFERNARFRILRVNSERHQNTIEKLLIHVSRARREV